MKYFVFCVVSLCILLGFLRFFPYIDGNIPLGYDPGIYREYFLSYFELLPNIDFQAHERWIQEIYEPWLWLLTNILLLIGYDVDFLITWGLVFLSLWVGIFVFLTLKHHGNVPALFAMSLYYISIVQYKAFWWNYYKQILWILFLLGTLYLFQKKKFFLAFPFLMSIFIINRPSGVFFLLLFFWYFLLQLFQERKILWKESLLIWSAGILAFGFYISVLEPQILQLLQPLVTTVWSDQSGTFFSSSEFGKSSIFIIAGSFWGLYVLMQSFFEKKQKPELWFFGFIIGALWTSLWLFFYNRFYIFFDLFMILLVWVFFGFLFENYKKIFIFTTTLFFSLQGYTYYQYISNNSHALISQIEFDKIQEIPTLVEEDAVIMVTHKNYSPWLQGYTRKPIIAPWLFNENRWNNENWNTWWKSSGPEKCEMIQQTYADIENLYVWIGKRQPTENIQNAFCFQVIFSDPEFIFLKLQHESK